MGRRRLQSTAAEQSEESGRAVDPPPSLHCCQLLWQHAPPCGNNCALSWAYTMKAMHLYVRREQSMSSMSTTTAAAAATTAAAALTCSRLAGSAAQ
eukprot:1153911-Pelagomonas_calceolata.AAC.4